MIIYKCKMCGGNLNVQENSKITVCEYCGTQQTVPSTDDEKRANLFNRANYFRQNSEFDKAIGIYEHIIEEDGSDSEAYWSLALCRYGIEYVEDPSTKERKPTVNRMQAQSILNDADYKMALEHADYSQKEVYKREAGIIAAIQKDIMQIAQKEKPYDVFISYKEEAPDGYNRTKSSVLAQDIYNILTKAGYRTFFSRISLEDKLGEKYEPYIYSALNSAKVMLVVATDKDEINAPWVKNEWSRFLAMMREDSGKTLIPCFRDMSIDELPNEFQILQGQDMSKIGAEQDLLHGIEKLIDKKGKNEAPQSNTSANSTSLAAVDMLLKNGETYMKLENYDEAFKRYKNVTDMYADDYRGWWGLIEAKTHNFQYAIPSNDDTRKQINVWFMYIQKLVSGDIYEEKLVKYREYCHFISKRDALEDKTYIENNIKEKAKDNLIKTKVSIENIEKEFNTYKAKGKDLDEELEWTIERINKVERENKIKRVRTIASIMVSLIFIILGNFVIKALEERDKDSSLGYIIIAIGAVIIGIYVLRFMFSKKKLHTVNGRVPFMEFVNVFLGEDNDRDDYYAQLSACKREKTDYESQNVNRIKKLYEKKDNLIFTSESMEELISLCNQYIGLKDEEVEKYFYVKNCYDFCEQDNISEDRLNELDDLRKSIYDSDILVCDVCGKKIKIQRNSNNIVCENCGAVYSI